MKGFACRITPSTSRTAIFSPPPRSNSELLPRTLKYSNEKITSAKRKNAPPPIRIQRSVRERSPAMSRSLALGIGGSGRSRPEKNGDVGPQHPVLIEILSAELSIELPR